MAGNAPPVVLPLLDIPESATIDDSNPDGERLLPPIAACAARTIWIWTSMDPGPPCEVSLVEPTVVSHQDCCGDAAVQFISQQLPSGTSVFVVRSLAVLENR